jgi:hypothetical protein
MTHKEILAKWQEGQETAGWIPVEQLPTGSMKVKWLCEDGVEDVGFYYSEQKEFASWDLCSQKPITHWKPLEDVPPACS